MMVECGWKMCSKNDDGTCRAERVELKAIDNGPEQLQGDSPFEGLECQQFEWGEYQAE